jgi:hypothetical protein
MKLSIYNPASHAKLTSCEEDDIKCEDILFYFIMELRDFIVCLLTKGR